MYSHKPFAGISNKPRCLLCEKKLHKCNLIKLVTQAQWNWAFND